MGWYFKQFDSDRQDLIDIQQKYIYFFEEYVIKPTIKKYLDACSILELENEISKVLKDQNNLIPEKTFRAINQLVALSFRWINYNSSIDLFSTEEQYSSQVVQEWLNYNIELGKVFLSDNKLINCLTKIVVYSYPSDNDPKDVNDIFKEANDYIYWYLFHILKIPNSSADKDLKDALFEKYDINENIYHPYFKTPKLPAPSIIDDKVDD